MYNQHVALQLKFRLFPSQITIMEQVHCCLLETSALNSWLLQSIQDGLYSDSWKFSCFQGSCVGRYVSHGIYYLCTGFRAVRGKSVLGEKGAVLLKWGFHLSHAVCFPILFCILRVLSFVEDKSATEKWTLGVWREELNNF